MDEDLKDLLRQFERVATLEYRWGGGRLKEDQMDRWEKRVQAAGAAVPDTGSRAEFTVFQDPEFRRARATEAMLRKVLEQWVGQLRAELTAGRFGPKKLPVSLKEAEEWSRSGATNVQRRELLVKVWEEVSAGLQALDEVLEYLAERGFRFRAEPDSIEYLLLPKSGVVAVWSDSPHGRLVQAVRQMSEYSGYGTRDLILYVLTGAEPELKAVTLTVWRGPAPTGDGPMHSYATIRLNEAPTTRELEGLRRDLLEQWEKPRERKERWVRKIMKPIIGKPGNWSVDHPWSMEYWERITKEYNGLGIEQPTTAEALKKWAYRRWAAM